MFMYQVAQKIVPNFEALFWLLMSEVLAFPASLDLYNSFDTLIILFHGLMNNLCRYYCKLFSKVIFSQNWNCKEFLS